MWARASEKGREKLFMSSVSALRQRLLEWSPKGKLAASERERPSQLASLPVTSFQEAPSEFVERQQIKTRRAHRPHIVSSQERPAAGASRSNVAGRRGASSFEAAES